MILKEDSPAILTTRPSTFETRSAPTALDASSSPLASERGYPSLTATISSLSHSIPSPANLHHRPAILPTSSSSSASGGLVHEDSPPTYRPPSFPPVARLNGIDPAPWRNVPLPRYKNKKRPLRFVPLTLMVAVSGFLLGACVNFMVESIIKIATTHIKPQMFMVFRHILMPSHILVAASTCSLLLSPAHHLLPLPYPPNVPFLAASTPQKWLIVTRLFLPLIGMLLNVIGGSWFLAVALQKAGKDENPYDSWMPIGNGVEIHIDPNFPGEPYFWKKWFLEDVNCKVVLVSVFLSLVSSLLFTLHAFPSTTVYSFFSGPDPPPWLESLEDRITKWYKRIVLIRLQGGSEESVRWAEEEEEEGTRELMVISQQPGQGAQGEGGRREMEDVGGRGGEAGERRRRRFGLVSGGFGRSGAERRRVGPGVVGSGS